jgi:hypothetical protein
MGKKRIIAFLGLSLFYSVTASALEQRVSASLKDRSVTQYGFRRFILSPMDAPSVFKFTLSSLRKRRNRAYKPKISFFVLANDGIGVLSEVGYQMYYPTMKLLSEWDGPQLF